MGTLDGKVAIITGAGQGVGQGIAFALAEAGATIVVVGRTESKLIDTTNHIRAAGGGQRRWCAISATPSAWGRWSTTSSNSSGVSTS